jgi:RNA 2',3'-cyclic 3'-phosphodiesterase
MLMRASSQVVVAAAGRRVPDENLHVTLLFLGSVGESRLPDVLGVGSSVARTSTRAATKLQLELNAVEFWKKPRLLVATAGAAGSHAEPVATIARALSEAAKSVGLLMDSDGAGSADRDFRPHVTLVRDARALGKQKIDAVTWSFRDFVLVQSRTTAHGSLYLVLQNFRIHAAQT